MINNVVNVFYFKDYTVVLSTLDKINLISLELGVNFTYDVYINNITQTYKVVIVYGG